MNRYIQSTGLIFGTLVLLSQGADAQKIPAVFGKYLVPGVAGELPGKGNMDHFAYVPATFRLRSSYVPFAISAGSAFALLIQYAVVRYSTL